MNGVANITLAAESSVGKISFIDLPAQQRQIRAAIERRLQAVLDHGRYIAGPEIDELEELLAARTGAAAAVSCASGTAALIIPLFAQKVGRGDAVFIPAFTYNATANAVLVTGATPVFVDIDPATFNMDAADLRRRVSEISERGELTPKAVIPVDLFGFPADYRAISAVAEEFDLFVLADGAQSFGGRLDERWVGDLAPATATSFFPGKALGAYGDAGAVLAQDAAVIEDWKSIRWHGTDASRKDSIRIGFNGRMDTFQAAVLLEKLPIFDDELAARRAIAAVYDECFSAFAKPQAGVAGASSGYGYYSLNIENRDRVALRLKDMGVPSAIYYATPLHRMQAFAEFAPAGGLPATEALSERILSLPMHPYLTPDQVDYICEAVLAAASD